jgi:CheY-like chemotaxis protein
VPKTLLAVDDSATMRKVLEISFAGEDYRVITADGQAGALTRLGEEPAAVVIDTSLGAEDGYALAREVRAKNVRTAIVLMASRYTPYDQTRGREAGADDYIDKPFDTQALIDKVKKAITARENVKPAVAPAPAPAPVPVQVPAVAVATAPVIAPPFGAPPRVAGAPGVAAKPAFATQRTHTLAFDGTPMPPPAAPAPIPISRTAPSGVPVLQPVQAPNPAPASPPGQVPSVHTVPTASPPRVAESVGPAVAVVNGHLAGKLGDLGLTPTQVEAVLTLSREVVERVVWEVVPQLAETLIKEEIARLTRDA